MDMNHAWSEIPVLYDVTDVYENSPVSMKKLTPNPPFGNPYPYVISCKPSSKTGFDK